MNLRKMKRKFRRNIKAISPVIATLLMIAIAVVASLVTYAWVMGYMNFTTTKVGKAIQIQSVDFTGKTVYVQNVGNSALAFTDPCVYVNGVSFSTGITPNTQLAEGGTIALQLSGNPFTAGTTYTIKVTSTDGTFSQVDKTYPLP